MRDLAKPITAHGIDRILAMIKPVPATIRVDKGLLLRELQLCGTRYSVRCGLRLTKKSSYKLKRLEGLLRDLCSDRATPWGLFCEETANLLKSTVISENLKSISRYRPTRRINANPIELLTGQDLPFVYKRFFRRKAGCLHHADGTPYGPYLEFAQAVLKEMSIPYSNGSICRALTAEGRHRER
jgi:hypothetical protein